MKQYLLFFLAILLFPSLSSAGTLTLEWEMADYPTLKELRIYRGGPANCSVLSPLPALQIGAGGVTGGPVIIPKPAAPATVPLSYQDLQVPDNTQVVCYEMTSVNTAGVESVRSKRKMILYQSTLPVPEITVIE